MGEMRTLVKVLSTPEDSDVDRFKLQFIMILQLDLSSSVLAFWTDDSYASLPSLLSVDSFLNLNCMSAVRRMMLLSRRHTQSPTTVWLP